ncbi:MAG TPA: ATP-dependent sacrificial sulfur transferase LarE [Acidimicrobiales bacterium]|nr:ATP-dependent sacrificial sulfur transferase LarE [Acidimicrobiales bacterium]
MGSLSRATQPGVGTGGPVDGVPWQDGSMERRHHGPPTGASELSFVSGASQLDSLRARLVELGSVVVAFSGGADSAFLAWVAHDTLGDQAHAVTAISPSLAPEEESDCRALAREWGLRWTPVITHELANTAYSANDGQRCYRCKAELMDALTPLAQPEGATVVLGVNVDDLGDHRPGQKAAAERGAAFPLLETGFTKADVRAWSSRLGLRTWDKPAAACLASRVPYGTPVTLGVLSSVAQAESALRRLGFVQLRVRHYGSLARLELGRGELAKAFEQRDAVVGAVHQAGYTYVTLDLEGFRSGNLNQALSDPAQVTA